MNLFVTDECPHQSARNLPDKLVVKMALENAQMLAANFSEEFLGLGDLPKKDGTPYKVTHKNHPCTKWGRESMANAMWMVAHGMSICEEYERRYNKVHACKAAHQRALYLLLTKGVLPSSFRDHSPFVRAMPEEIKNDDTISTVEAYQKYMHTKHYAKWKHGNEPEWWNHDEHQRVQGTLQS
jgi:hypothetical protein